MKQTMILAALGLMLGCTAASAQQCRTFVNGSEIVVDASAVDTGGSTENLRERALRWPSKTWNKAWGTPPPCKSSVTIAYLAQNAPEVDVAAHCLSTLEDGSFLLVPGKRNYRGLCRKTVCERVNTTKEEAIGITGRVVGTVKDTVAGVSSVAHSSGATLLTGSTSYIASQLGSAGSTALTAAATPTTLTVVALGAVGIGGAIYLCRE